MKFEIDYIEKLAKYNIHSIEQPIKYVAMKKEK